MHPNGNDTLPYGLFRLHDLYPGDDGNYLWKTMPDNLFYTNHVLLYPVSPLETKTKESRRVVFRIRKFGILICGEMDLWAKYP